MPSLQPERLPGGCSPLTGARPLVRRGALGFPSEAVIVDHPANMLKLFYRSAKYQIPVSEQALDQVKKHLDLIDEETRSSSEVRDLFLKLLKQTQRNLSVSRANA